MSSPALSRSQTASLGLHPSSPAFRGVMTSLSPALSHQPTQRNNNKLTNVQQRISPTFSVASETSTSPGLSFSLSQTHSNSSRPSTPSSLVVKSKALSPGPGRPVVVELNSKELSGLSGRSDQRGFKRARDNDEETMTGFDVFIYLFIYVFSSGSILIVFITYYLFSCLVRDQERAMEEAIGLGRTNAVGIVI